jgi:predicted metal-dependent hydrolase
MSEEKRYVHVSGKEVPYFLKLNLHQKNIILRVKNDSIYVSAPDFAAIEDIEMMIRQHYPKIARAQLGFELNQKYDLFSPNP